jgi:guanosine-3',5'-bis(diphosphate) 3'-pyrophosphohydrolase
MSDKDDVIEKVKRFATGAHGDQKRKYTPEPYIVHPIRVMEICREYTDDVAVLSAALLHDVLEDTPVSKKELLDFLMSVMDREDATRTLQLVTDLTDVYIKTDYPQLNRRQRKQRERERVEKTQPDAQTVKYADIIDNCREIVKHDRDFARVFLGECRAVLSRTDKGNQELYRRAVHLVNEAIQSL